MIRAGAYGATERGTGETSGGQEGKKEGGERKGQSRVEQRG